MICPDWEALIRLRRSESSETAAWRQAIRHLDSCDPCRRRALLEDPLLVFRRLGRGRGGAQRPSDSEVQSMRREVQAVARSRALERRRRRRVWPRVAAATLFVAVLLTLAADAPELRPTERLAGDVPSRIQRVVHAAVRSTDLPPVSMAEVQDRPAARVYELRQRGVSVVMIVDETLDV